LSSLGTVQLWRQHNSGSVLTLPDKVSITPNVAILPAIYDILLSDQGFKTSLNLELNPCLPQSCEGLEKLEWLYFDGLQEAFQHISTNELLTWLIKQFQQNERSVNYKVLLNSMSQIIDGATEEHEALLSELVDIGFLSWKLPENGLSPSWLNNLISYLSHLDSSARLTDTIVLLQFIRNTGKSIPYLSIEDALNSQAQALDALNQYFARYKGGTAVAKPEHLYYEDVERTHQINCPIPTIQSMIKDLEDCWKNIGTHPMNELGSRLKMYAKSNFEIDEVIDFQFFCKEFMNSNIASTIMEQSRYDGKIGALLQVYKQENSYKGVVNALFPGGGKLYSRWLHLFPQDFHKSIESWIDPEEYVFPWQSWSNANFQAIRFEKGIQMPGGKAHGRRNLLFSDLGVKCLQTGPVLINKITGNTVQFIDLGLEAPEQRPPVVQILWQLGIPNVSSSFLSGNNNRWVEIAEGIKMRNRVEYKSLILSRQAWFLDSSFLTVLTSGNTGFQFFNMLNEQFNKLGLPQHFFAKKAGGADKPQHFDGSSPVSILVFQKLIKSIKNEALLMEEMLPSPAHWVLGGEEKYASEFVIELKVS
ncbi:MAG: hypothetical protein KDC86_05170, partial [Saprospiraceae bacterium]|nr:hypothetical protein [Saprospiraceae bacterium]